jgi:predicted NAD/FAD-dependent oxidoreductase
VKTVVQQILFQPPSPPSYVDEEDIIWLQCKRSKQKHNTNDNIKVLIPGIYLKSKK